MHLRFDEEKATQTAALILKKRGGRMHYIKLIKLLYLIDREALRRWGIPVTTDHYASMEHGPVVSTIYRLITDEKPGSFWDRYISAPLGDREIELLSGIEQIGSSRLSRAEENLINEIYDQYGHMNRWKLIEDVMHKLPEWRDPGESSIPIHIRQILLALGHGNDDVHAILRELRTVNTADEVFSSTV